MSAQTGPEPSREAADRSRGPARRPDLPTRPSPLGSASQLSTTAARVDNDSDSDERRTEESKGRDGAEGGDLDQEAQDHEDRCQPQPVEGE